MSGKYDDILYLPHPTSAKHPRMPISDRAAIFSPFAALTGHGDAIQETARLTEQKMELDEDAKAELDRRQAVLLEHISESEVLAALASLKLAINRKNLTRPFPLSLAIGYSTGYCAPIELMLSEADQNMYQQKRQMKSFVAG